MKKTNRLNELFKNKKQLNVSGSYLLYTQMQKQSLCAQITLTEKVDVDLLQKAVDRTQKRMPYLGDVLTLDKGKFYYTENTLPFVVTEFREGENVLRPTGCEENNFHLIDCVCQGNDIWVSMNHYLCDGLGSNLFIEATLLNYFSLKDGVEYEVDGVRFPGSPILPGEEEDQYDETYEVSPDYKPLGVSAIQDASKVMLPEIVDCDRDPAKDGYLFTELVLDEKEFVSFCKERSSSPAATLATFLSEVIIGVHPELFTIDNPVIGLIPISSRRFLGKDNTFKNTSTSVLIPFKKDNSKSFAEKCADARLKLKSGINPNRIRFETNAAKRMERLLATSDDYETIRNMFRKVPNYSVGTFTIDYVGGLRLGDTYRDRIDSFRYLCVMGNLDMFVSTNGGKFIITLGRCFSSDVYDRELEKKLKEQGLSVRSYALEPFKPPVTKLFDELGIE